MANIAIYTCPEGHLSIAQAIQASLEPHYQVSLFFDRNALFDVYKPIYQLAPAAMKLPYTLSQLETSKKLIPELFNIQYDKKISKFYKETQPDLCISTFYMFNPSLQHVSDIAGKPFINVLADPRTIHPLFIAPNANYNLTFDQQAADLCQEFCESTTKCQPTGWFVKPEFETEYDLPTIRRQLNLDPDVFTILISSGSEGTTMVMKLLPFLVQLDKPVQVIVACGNNKVLFNSVKAFHTLLKKVKENTHILALEYVTNMHQYMMAADLIVGKAGPNSLFESVATHTPFFAITHISGQEDGNLDLITEMNLGYVEENAFKAQTLLQNIVENPDQLKTFQPSLKKLATYNRKSKEKLIKLVEKLI